MELEEALRLGRWLVDGEYVYGSFGNGEVCDRDNCGCCQLGSVYSGAKMSDSVMK